MQLYEIALLLAPIYAVFVGGQSLNQTSGCSLCEDQSGVPFPSFEVIPSKTCLEFQQDAAAQHSTENGDDDLSPTCTAWQQTIGAYCGCDNPTSTQDVCRLCGANSMLSEPNRLFSQMDKRQQSTDTKTCVELEWEANQPGANCESYQELYSECCLVECPLCKNPEAVPQDLGAVFVAGDDVVSCQTALNLGTPRLAEDDCQFWQYRGDTLCHCSSEQLRSNDCRLCEDGSPLPEPRRAGLPGRSCSVLQADAIRDDPSVCPTWQKTVGKYCGCGNEKVSEGMCKICGDYDLPSPVQTIDTRSIENFEEYTPCGKLEFMANLEGSDCDLYQFMFKDCCKNLVLHSDEEPRRDVAHPNWRHSYVMHLLGYVCLPTIFSITLHIL